MKEALASSRIEGTQAELKSAFQADARPQMQSRFPEVATVLRVVDAIQHGLDEVRQAGHVSVAIALSVHRKLIQGEHGGTIRDHAVWVGSPTDRPHNADYVPPVPERLEAALAAWEQFAQERNDLPPLVRAAMLHYQFLTIHPFHDGNGRVARILVPLFLAAEGRLPEPLLYLSPYLELRRREYYDRLQIVRERGDIEQWIQFFVTAVEAQARDGVDRGERLLDLLDRYRNELAGSRSRSSEVVDLLFSHAVISTAMVRDALGVSHQGALNLIRGLENRGWLVPSATSGRGGAQYWIAVEVVDAVERDIENT
jgi:Fic family protein